MLSHKQVLLSSNESDIQYDRGNIIVVLLHSLINKYLIIMSIDDNLVNFSAIYEASQFTFRY